MVLNNKTLELERTYLVKRLPADLASFSSKEMLDIYIPSTATHPILRIRKQGDRMEITKKHPVKDGDASTQSEETIPLSEKEYKQLCSLPGKRVAKTRYYYRQPDLDCEIDVFKEDLAGLVLVDIEFNSKKDKQDCKMPDFCLLDATQETFLAGGMLCGKSYDDIQDKLEKLGYKKITTGVIR